VSDAFLENDNSPRQETNLSEDELLDRIDRLTNILRDRVAQRCRVKLDQAHFELDTPEPDTRIGVITDVLMKTLTIGADVTVLRRCKDKDRYGNHQYEQVTFTMGYETLTDYAQANPVISSQLVTRFNADVRAFMQCYQKGSPQEITGGVGLLRYDKNDPAKLLNFTPKRLAGEA
jgi:hypothetical protein